MNKLTEKLIRSYTVLYYYYLIDNTQGKPIDEIPSEYRAEVELKANERYINEYLEAVGDTNAV